MSAGLRRFAYTSWSALLDYTIEKYKITCVNAAGNNYDNNSIITPSNGLNVICVGSISKNKKISDFSGAGMDSNYTSALYKPTLVAPGEELKGIPNKSGTATGTSFAAPFVTGIVALLMEEFPDLKYHPEQIMSVLTDSCLSVRGQNSFHDHDAGFGLVNYKNAREAYSNTYGFQIYNEESKSALFSTNINLPSGKTILASSNVLYHTIYEFSELNGTTVNVGDISPDELRHSNVNMRVKTNNGDNGLTGFSKSNISYLAFTNDSNQNQNITLEVFLDGAKNSDFVEDCSVSYRIFTNYSWGLNIPRYSSATYDQIVKDDYFDKPVTIPGQGSEDMLLSFENSGYKIFFISGDCRDKEIRLYDSRNNLLETSDGPDESGSLYIKRYVERNDRYVIKIINNRPSNTRATLKLCIFSSCLDQIEELNLNGDETTVCYGGVDGIGGQLLNITITEKGYYDFYTAYASYYPVIMQIRLIKYDTNSLLQDNVDYSTGVDTQNPNPHLIKKCQKGEKYLIFVTSQTPNYYLNTQLYVDYLGKELINANEIGYPNSFTSNPYTTETFKGVYIPNKTAYVCFDTAVYNTNFSNVVKISSIKDERGNEIPIDSRKTDDNNKEVVVALLQKGEKYFIEMCKYGVGSSYSGKVNLIICYRGTFEDIYTLTCYNNYKEMTCTLYGEDFIVYKMSFEDAGNKIFQTFGKQDTKLALYDEAGNLLASESGKGYSYNALINYNVSSYTTYLLRVSLENSSQGGQIKTTITPYFRDTYYFYSLPQARIGETYSRSFTLEENSSQILVIQPNLEGDYTFFLESTDSNTQIDTYLHVITCFSAEAEMEYIDYDDDSGDDGQSLLTKRLGQNYTYYVIISAFDNTYTGNVTLHITKN